MWRVSSVTITAVPVYIPLMFGLGRWLENTDFDTIGDIAYFSFFPAGILYILARAVTIVLALTSLRDLPPIRHRSLDHLHTSCIAYPYASVIYL